jgi:hypothetical protein
MTNRSMRFPSGLPRRAMAMTRVVAPNETASLTALSCEAAGHGHSGNMTLSNEGYHTTGMRMSL